MPASFCFIIAQAPAARECSGAELKRWLNVVQSVNLLPNPTEKSEVNPTFFIDPVAPDPSSLSLLPLAKPSQAFCQ
jgi:hypothetical protein